MSTLSFCQWKSLIGKEQFGRSVPLGLQIGPNNAEFVINLEENLLLQAQGQALTMPPRRSLKQHFAQAKLRQAIGNLATFQVLPGMLAAAIEGRKIVLL